MRGDFLLQEEKLLLAAKPNAKTILVVEDDEDISLILTEAISMLTPYEVQVARNSTEALHFVKHSKPDLFILDYRLPPTNGIKLYDQLHALPGLENIAAIIISGITSREVTRDIESRQLIRIEKPFDLDEFLETVKQALG
jgi:DNA-binding NtrC family response regulator